MKKKKNSNKPVFLHTRPREEEGRGRQQREIWPLLAAEDNQSLHTILETIWDNSRVYIELF